ncbi:unnamed protein product, partial [marine sediment metagenome]
FVAPLLKRYGFGATFFVTEGLGYQGNEQHWITWEEIRKLHEMGFEIGNHTGSHPNLAQLSKEEIIAEVKQIERACEEHGVPKPTTLGYPGGFHDHKSVEALDERGYLFARRGRYPEYPVNIHGGRGPVYDPQLDHPLLVPAAYVWGDRGQYQDMVDMVDLARDGKIAVFVFHGVPDFYPHCSTAPVVFERFLKYLHDQGCTVIALRDLAKYIDPARRPADPYEPIRRRLVTPVQLKCEYAVNPLGVDVAQPRFSWILESSERGQIQSAYRILVTSNKQNLKLGTAD